MILVWISGCTNAAQLRSDGVKGKPPVITAPTVAEVPPGQHVPRSVAEAPTGLAALPSLGLPLPGAGDMEVETSEPPVGERTISRVILFPT